MQIAQLRTLIAIENTGSFSAAAAQVNLSHSAVSVQMKQLEASLGAEVFVKGRRPAMLTPMGRQLTARARHIVADLDALAVLGRGDNVTGEISVGFVPTTLTALLPVVLAGLRARFSGLRVSVRSGLSQGLARAVENGELDFAFLTAPAKPSRDVVVTPIAEEPLIIISPLVGRSVSGIGPLLKSRPYIAFSRETWLGGQIELALGNLGMALHPETELDSIDAIELLVAEGYGNSIVPQRVLARPISDRVVCRRLPGAGAMRSLTLASHQSAPRETLRAAMVALITEKMAAEAAAPR